MRKLAWATLSFTAAILLRHYVLPQSAVLYTMALLGLLAGLGAFVPDRKQRMKIFLVCVFALLGVARYEWQIVAKVRPAEALVGETCRITAEVTEYPAVYDDYTRIAVKLDTEGLPPVKMMLYDYEPGDLQLKPGDRIRTLVKLRSAMESGGDITDTYISKGVYLRGTAQEVIVYAGTCDDSWKYAPLYFGKAIRDALDTSMTPRTAAFMKALLTGEKTDLHAQPEIYHIITRSGISHVVAVSGMHVSFMVGLAVFLFGGGRGWGISIGLAALFAVMTGLSPSVMRALLMQTLFLAAPLLRREADNITSICFPLLVLMILNPFSIASISLQLSFGAMWGILLLTPPMAAWFGERGKCLTGFAQKAYRYVYASVTMSVGATVFTAPLCAYYFGTIGLLSPLTNLLVLWLVPVCFAVGFAVFLLSFVSGTLSSLLGAVLSLGVELIYALAGLVAESPFAVVYLPNGLMVLCFVITYLIFTVSYFIKGKELYCPVPPMMTALVLLAVMVVGVKLYHNNGTTVGAVDVGQGQSIVLLHEEDTLVIDCGGSFDAGERTARYLYEHGRSDVDMLVVTHFDRDHVNGVIDLLIQIPVKELMFCGANLTAEEAEAFAAIQTQAERSGTVLRLVNRTSVIECGAIRVNTFASEEGLIALVQAGDFELLVTGDADAKTEQWLVKQYLPKGDCLVVGHHGSKYSTSELLLDSYSPEICLISCGYNTYGHPADEVLRRLRDRNVVVYRTDNNGSISLKVR